MSGPRRTRTRLARAGGLLASVVLVGLGVIAPVGTPGGPSSAVAATTSDAEVVVAITKVEPQVLRPDQDLTVTATVRNDTTTEVVAPRATLRINRFRMADTAELSAWSDLTLTDRTAGSAVRSVDLGAPLARGASAEVVVTIPADAVGLNATPDAWGPRGLALEVTDGARRVGIERTFLLWLFDDDVRQARVSALVPVVGDAIDLPSADPAPSAGTPTPAPSDAATAPAAATTTGPPATEGSGTADPVATESPVTGAGATSLVDPGLEDLTSSDGRLQAALRATSEYPEVSWAVDPALLDQAAAGGESARAWLDALTRQSARRDVFALPWGDPDLAALAHADRSDLLELATDASSASTSAVFGSSSRTDVLWPADEIPDMVTAAFAAGSGARGLVVGPTALASTSESGPTPSGLARVPTAAGTVSALVPDAALSALLTDADEVEPGATPATAAQRALAETAVVAHEGTTGSPHLLATVPRDWSPDVAIVQAELAALATAPWVALTSVSGLLGSSDDGTERTSLPESARSDRELSPARVDALADARTDVATFATILAEPYALLTGLDRDVLAPLAVAWRPDRAGRNAVVDAVLAESTERRTGLTVQVNPKFNVIASTAPIRLTVHSDLASTATVRVELRPRKACMTIPEPPAPTVVAPGTDEVVSVDVRANASCEVIVDVLLMAEDGTVVAAPAQFSARLAPTVEIVGMGAIGLLLAVGLVVGIIRTVRRGRNSTRVATGELQAVTAATPGAAPQSLDETQAR